MKKTKRLFAVILTVLLSLCLFACDAQLSVYHQAGADADYTVVELVLHRATEADIQAGAATDNTGRLFTLRGYLEAYAGEVGAALRRTPDGDYVYYEFSFPDDVAPDFLSARLQGSAVSEIKRGFFIHTVEVKKSNPFNGLYEEFESKAAANDDFLSAVGILASGRRVYTDADMSGQPFYRYDQKHGKWYYEKLPAVKEAFPALKGMDEKSLILNYLMAGSPKMITSGTRVSGGDGSVYYLWSVRPGGAGEVVYKYFRANGAGWLTLSLILGGLSVGLVFLICYLRGRDKNKGGKGDVKELFPYDPNKP